MQIIVDIICSLFPHGHAIALGNIDLVILELVGSFIWVRLLDLPILRLKWDTSLAINVLLDYLDLIILVELISNALPLHSGNFDCNSIFIILLTVPVLHNPVFFFFLLLFKGRIGGSIGTLNRIAKALRLLRFLSLIVLQLSISHWRLLPRHLYYYV